MTNKLIDRREPGFYIVDNEIIEVFGARLGVYGISVYNVLLKFSSSSGENAFPSYQTIANLLSISRTKAIESVELLLEYGLIEKTTRKSASGDPSSNLYTLLDVKKITGGSAPHALGSTQSAPGGSAPHALGSTQSAPDQDPLINTPSDQYPSTKKGEEASPSHPNTVPIKNAYIEVLGYVPDKIYLISTAAKKLAQLGYTPQEVIEAYNIIKQDSFWKKKFVSLEKVLKEIREILNYTKEKEETNGQVASSNGLSDEEIERIRSQRRERKAATQQ